MPESNPKFPPHPFCGRALAQTAHIDAEPTRSDNTGECERQRALFSLQGACHHHRSDWTKKPQPNWDFRRFDSQFQDEDGRSRTKMGSRARTRPSQVRIAVRELHSVGSSPQRVAGAGRPRLPTAYAVVCAPATAITVTAATMTGTAGNAVVHSQAAGNRVSLNLVLGEYAQNAVPINRSCHRIRGFSRKGLNPLQYLICQHADSPCAKSNGLEQSEPAINRPQRTLQFRYRRETMSSSARSTECRRSREPEGGRLRESRPSDKFGHFPGRRCAHCPKHRGRWGLRKHPFAFRTTKLYWERCSKS